MLARIAHCSYERVHVLKINQPLRNRAEITNPRATKKRERPHFKIASGTLGAGLRETDGPADEIESGECDECAETNRRHAGCAHRSNRNSLFQSPACPLCGYHPLQTFRDQEDQARAAEERLREKHRLLDAGLLGGAR